MEQHSEFGAESVEDVVARLVPVPALADAIRAIGVEWSYGRLVGNSDGPDDVESIVTV